jgi:predicted NBD/HSP70 family sugar kinase
LVLEGDDAFEVIIGQRPPPGATIWERVDITLSNFRARRGNNSRIPTAYLARQLQILYFCYPAEMFELRVQGDERIKGLSAYTSLWLPRQDLPSVEDLENLAKTSKGLTDPKLLVARYAASMVLNRSIGFGWPARVFESVEAGTPTEQWIKLIQWVAVRNAHEEWFKYLGKYRAAPPDQPYPVPQRVCVAKAADSIADSLVLGVDIGGMGTKIALYGYDPKSRTLSRPLCEHRFETKRPGGQQYENAEAFAKRLDEELARAWLEWPSYRDRLVAIGVTWPGAVAGRPGLEYVAANSGALAYFMPFPPTKHWEAEAAAIRRLCLREAFEKHFERGGWCPYVRLINDGVAHVLFEHWQLKQFAPRSGEIVVGHTAGMGAGMAVLDAHTGNPLDVLAELGRLITHISDPFPPPEAPPAGQGRDAFNTLTLGAVATKLLKQKLVEPGTASHFITGKLSSNPEIVSQILALALGDSTSTPTPWSLPQVPSLLVGWLIEEKHATRPDAKTAPYFEGLWNPKKTSSVPSLLDLRKSLHDFLKDIGCSDWPDEQAFATDVVKRAGYELADLIATTVGLFGATNVITGGGPLSDYVGKELRDAARDALRDDYKFEVVENALMSGVKGHHLARLIRFPEPYDSTIPLPRPTGPSAPFGAASAVIELLPRL